MSKGRFEREKEKPRAGRIALIIGLVLLILVLIAAIGVFIYYNAVLNKMNHVEVPQIQYTTTASTEETDATEMATEEETEPTETEHVASSEDYINILVVGQASRAGDVERMADTMILVTLNKYEKTISLTSFLRDSLVQPPRFRNHGFGQIKLTTVYHLGSYYDNGNIAGSMELMNMTLYNNFGVEVDYNFEVDFEAFVKIIDIMGGIGVDLTEAEAKYLNADDRWVHMEVKPGWNWLDGSAALSFARMRKAEGDGESDINRTSRQRYLLNNILDQMQYMGLSKVQKMANEVLPYVTTSMSNSEITELLMELLPMLMDLEIKNSGTCPVAGTYSGKMYDIYDDGFMHSVLTFNTTKQWELMRAITEGEVPESETGK